MPTVSFIPRHVAESMSSPENTLLISITHPGELADVDHWSNLMRLAFDDITFQSDGYILFDLEMAKKILDRIASFDGDVIVHCEAGMSRSAAIAKWLALHKGYEMHWHPGGIGTTQYANDHVFSVMCAANGDVSMADYYREQEERDRIYGWD